LKVCAIIPTYNERENLKGLLPQILLLEKNIHVLIVDDASPDGTSDEVRHMMKKNRRLHLITRPNKRGIGSAYRDAFAYSMIKIRPDVIIQMDADFSHAPADILRLLGNIGSYDVIVGSRYVRGGRIRGWPIRRRLVSESVNFFAKIATGLPEKDVSSGFKCFRSGALALIRLGDIRSNDRSFQFELLYQFKKAGLNVLEVPIDFTERIRGEEKFSITEAYDFVRTLIPYFTSRGRLKK